MITKVDGFCVNNTQVLKNKNNVTFNGLTNRMGKKIYNGFYSMDELFPKDKTKNPIAGRLPRFMEKRIKLVTNDIESGVKEIFAAFTKTCEELRGFEPNAMSTPEEITNKRSNSTVKDLRNVLEKYKIIGKWDDFDLSYIDKGGKGSVWKLEGLRHVEGTTEDEFVIKVFHTKSTQANAYHGCYPEINAATYWMKTLGPETNRGKFFWGDVNEAYMINKFIDEDVRLPKKRPVLDDYGVKFTDEDLVHIHNVCKNYSFDWGGGVVINQVINSNRFARAVMKDIKSKESHYRTTQWYKRFHWKPNGNYDSKFAGLSLAIKYLKPEDRVSCFEKCMTKRGKYNDRAMGYTLKYLHPDVAKHYYSVLATSSNDKVLKEILVNEIPLLSVKDEYSYMMQDDLIVMNGLSKDWIDKYIDPEKFQYYTKLSKECHLQ